MLVSTRTLCVRTLILRQRQMPPTGIMFFSRNFPFLQVEQSGEKSQGSIKITASELYKDVKEIEKHQAIKTEITTEATKKSLMTKIKDELKHYWNSTKLLWVDMKVSSKLASQMLKGEVLTWRERQQLKRTTGDMFRLVPFSLFLIVPFLEFTLPIFLKLFPRMLPSTFETPSQRESYQARLQKVRLDTAGFLKSAVHDLVTGDDAKSRFAADFVKTLQEARHNGKALQVVDIIKYSQLFEDELTLENLNRFQLVSLCKFMGISSLGPSTLLRRQLRKKLDELLKDDLSLAKYDLQSLTLTELQNACQARGMRVLGLSAARLRSELAAWLDWHLQKHVPATLLLLSRVFSLPDDKDIKRATEEALKSTLSSLSEDMVSQVKEKSGMMTNEERLKYVQQEERKIVEERSNK